MLTKMDVTVYDEVCSTVLHDGYQQLNVFW